MSDTEKSEAAFKISMDIEIPPEHQERMRMIMYACGLSNFSELVNHSFSILEWATLETMKGHQVCSYSPDSGNLTLLDAPALTTVNEKRDEALVELKAQSD